ncbi:unnamed protein product, partial [Rotaria magnacalcarata]
LEPQSVPFSSEHIEDEVKIVSIQDQVSPVTDVGKEEETKVETRVEPESVSTEQKDDEAKIVSIQEQASPVTDVGNEDATNLESAVETQPVPISTEQSEEEV